MISIVAAYDDACGIGKDNKMPWHCPEDLKFFKELTTGHTVVMGYNTWMSLPLKPLPNRTNVLVTKKHYADLSIFGCTVTNTLESIIPASRIADREVFIIGGASIYKQALEMGIVDKMYLTHVHGMYQCDTYFPDIAWGEWSTESMKTDESVCETCNKTISWTRRVLCKKG